MAGPVAHAWKASSVSHCGHHEIAVLALDRPQQLEAEEARLIVDGMGAVGEPLLQFGPRTGGISIALIFTTDMAQGYRASRGGDHRAR